MSIQVTVFDGLTPLVDQIALVSREAALECLSVAGAHLQSAARDTMRRKQTPWRVRIGKNGRPYLDYNTANRKELGLRISHSTGDPVGSMSNFITNYLNEKSMLAVVGGRHRAFVPKKRENGEVMGSLKRVSAVSKRSHAILHMMNFGEELNDYAPGFLPVSKRYGYRFMEQGYRAAQGKIQESMTKRYERIIHRHANRGDIKVVKRVVA